MPFPEDPEDLQIGYAFGHSAAEDPTGLAFETISPAGSDDPGPALAPATIAAGRRGNASTTQPTQIQLGGLRNDDGEFSPRNVTGNRYGTLRRGTPMQISVDVGGGFEPLATGAQPDWSPTSAGPGIDRRVSVDALGVLSLLGRDDEPVSPLSRVGRVWRPLTNVLTGWWPCESGDGAITSTPSGISGGSAATVEASDGQPASAGSASGLPGASGALDLPTGASLRGPLHHVRDVLAGLWAFDCAVKISSQALGDRIVFYAPDGSRYLVLGTAGTSAIGVVLTSGATTNSLSGTATIADGKWHWISILVDAATFGTDPAVVSLYVDGVAVTLTGSITITSNEAAEFLLTGVDSVSQIFHWRQTYTPEYTSNAYVGYAGEQAHQRIERLLVQGQHSYEITGTESAEMGPQPTAGLLEILRECEATDEGMLLELRNGLVAYLCRATLENQSDPWTLTYTDIAGVWPDYSDQFLRNSITARSPDGVTATVEAEGDLGTSATTGIGRRPAPISRNPYQPTTSLIHSAGYALARATLDLPRCHIGLNLHGEPQLAAEWLARFMGSRVVVTDLPEQLQQDLGPGDLDVIIVGAEQYLDAGVWTLDLMCEPYELFAVHTLAAELPADDDPWVGWLEFDSCALSAAVNKTATAWSITCTPADSSDANDFPRRHYIGGELVTVTASTGGTSPTWTVTRSVNEVAKAHSAGAEIELADPVILALS